MTEQIASLLTWLILGIAVVVWMWAVRYVSQAADEGFLTGLPERMDPATAPQANDLVTGEILVSGDVGELPYKAARVLAQPQISHLGLVRVLTTDSKGVTFEQMEQPATVGAAAWVPSGNSGQGQSMMRLRVRTGEVRFEQSAPGSARARYYMLVDGRRGLLTAAWILLLVGFVAIVITGAVMELFVIHSANTAVRWQVVQCLQVSQILWPPFALAWTYKQGRRALVTRVETMLANLPYQA